MARPIVYSNNASPPCRTVLLAAEALGIALDIRVINVFEKAHLMEEFKKINPQHTVPTLDDNGFVSWDSHAIICYLADKYGKDDSVYPKDLQKRAQVDQRLYFDSGILYVLTRAIGTHIFGKGHKTVDPERKEFVEEAYDFLNKFLEGNKWLVPGDSYTLADISCVATVSSLDAYHPIGDYPNVIRWLKTCEREIPGYEKANAPGNKMFHELVKQRMS